MQRTPCFSFSQFIVIILVVTVVFLCDFRFLQELIFGAKCLLLKERGRKKEMEEKEKNRVERQ